MKKRAMNSHGVATGSSAALHSTRTTQSSSESTPTGTPPWATSPDEAAQARRQQRHSRAHDDREARGGDPLAEVDRLEAHQREFGRETGDVLGDLAGAVVFAALGAVAASGVLR